MGNKPFSYLFESVEGGEKWARYSLIGLPCSTIISVKKNKITVTKNEKVVEEIILRKNLIGIFPDHLVFLVKWKVKDIIILFGINFPLV